jgi:hypothetical protein
MPEELYPKIVTANELEELTDGKLSKARAEEIKLKVNELKKDLARYKKVRRKWKLASKILHGVGVAIGVAIGGAAAGLAIAATEGVLIPAGIPIGLAVGGAIETAITESIAVAVIKKKKHKFDEKINLVSLFVNRMYLFYQRALDDRKITIEELEEFHKIVSEYEMEKTNQSNQSESHVFSKLQHQAEVNARKEVQKELLTKLTEQKVNDFKSKFTLN